METGQDSALHWARVLDPIVAEQYALRTGNKVRRVNAILQHPTHPWMLANLDREVVGDSEVQMLECKTARINGAKLWRNGVPEYVQVMHQLAVTEQQAADVAVLISGQKLESQCKHSIQESMQEASVALFANGKVTWKQSNP